MGIAPTRPYAVGAARGRRTARDKRPALRYPGGRGNGEPMTDTNGGVECKHGLRLGCSYCHAGPAPVAVPKAGKTRRTGAGRLAEQMNDRMTALNRRLRELRAE